MITSEENVREAQNDKDNGEVDKDMAAKALYNDFENNQSMYDPLQVEFIKKRFVLAELVSRQERAADE